MNQSINYTNLQKTGVKVEQCIDLITVFNIYTVVGTMCKAKLCPVKLCPPRQYFMIILSWNFVLSMIFCPLSGQYNIILWTIYHSETVS